MSKPAKNISVPWTDVVNKDAWYTSYKEVDETSELLQVKRYIFVPNDTHGPGFSKAVINAYNLAILQSQVENWGGFQISIKVGEDMEQEIDRLYIELIPSRRNK